MTAESSHYVNGGNVTPKPIPALAGSFSQSSRALNLFSLLLVFITGITIAALIPLSMILAATHNMPAARAWAFFITIISSFVIFIAALSVHLWNQQR